MLSTSIKADVVHDTHAARARVGEVFIFDPTACTGLQHTPWSPIAAAHTWEGARRTAANLLGVGDHGAGRSADETFWKPAGARYLAPLLLAAAHGELTMAEVLRWVAAVEEDEPTELLKSCANPGAAGRRSRRCGRCGRPTTRFRSSLMQTIATGLDAWHEPAIAAATVGESQISAERLLAGPNTLYLIAPAHEQRRLRGLFTALVADITAGAFERSAQTGRPIDPPLLLALDEAANIAPLPEPRRDRLDRPRTGRAAADDPAEHQPGLRPLGQRPRGDDHRQPPRPPVLLRASATARPSTTCAKRSAMRRSTASPPTAKARSPPGRGPTAASSARSPHPHRVRQADTNTALLIYGRLQPAWVNLRPWYANRELRQLVSGDAPATADAGRAASAARRAHPRRHARSATTSEDPVSRPIPHVTPVGASLASRSAPRSRRGGWVCSAWPGFSPRPAWASKPAARAFPSLRSAPPAGPRPTTGLVRPHQPPHEKEQR